MHQWEAYIAGDDTERDLMISHIPILELYLVVCPNSTVEG